MFIFHSFLYSNSGAMGTWSAQFDGSGTRLLCYEKDPSQLVVYELTTRRQQQQPISVGKIRLTAPNFTNKDVGRSACCFSGLQDELLVVSGSDSRDLYVWSLPSDDQSNRTVIDQPVKIFHGHQRNILKVSYNSNKSALLSHDTGGVIKLWTPGAQL